MKRRDDIKKSSIKPMGMSLLENRPGISNDHSVSPPAFTPPLPINEKEQAQLLLLANQALKSEILDRMRTQKEILEISGREQKRIGQDLHDGLAQQMAAISFLCKVLWKKLNDKSSPEAAQALEILELSKKAISETKSMARRFYPIELERLGFFPALEELLINIEKTFAVHCCYHFDPGLNIADHAVATHLYRIIQEATHNAIRHGKAKTVVISVERCGEQVVLSIKDDGLGFPKDHRPENEMGLRIMRYRAKMIGADLRVDEPPAGGVLLDCRFSETAREKVC